MWEKFLKLISNEAFWLALAGVVDIVVYSFTGVDIKSEMLAIINAGALFVSAIIALIKKFSKEVHAKLDEHHEILKSIHENIIKG